MDTKFYYIRFGSLPVITVCLIKEGYDIYRGVAICGCDDMPVKKVGRFLAENRALRAMKKRTNTDPIGRFEISLLIDTLVDGGLDTYRYKSSMNYNITEFERSLFDNRQ